MGSREGAHVGQSDAFTVSLERDPLLRSTIVAVVIFDTAPDWLTLVERVERATRLVPTFRQRLTRSPLGLAPPLWITDPDFDLSFHLRRVEVAAPKTIEAVLEMARIEGMTAFDPARPLWGLTLVEGMAEGRAALIMKVHHALTDGIGGIQIMAHVVDLEKGPVDVGPMPEAPEATARGPLDAWRELVGYDLAHVAGALNAHARSLPGVALRALRHPIGTASDALATGIALARFVRPILSTRSPVMVDRRLQWHFSALDVPLLDLKRAAGAAGGSINDGFIAGITSGLRDYHREHGAEVDSLRATMPISIRRADDAEGGNRITLVRFEVSLGADDVAERIREIDRRCRELRDDPALAWTEGVAGLLNLLPSSITGGMLKHVDFLVSDVPGFADPVYVGGAQVIGFYPFGPTLGSAANITLMSYRGTCHVGVTTDAGAIADPAVLVDCLRGGFEEVLGSIGPHAGVTVVAP